MDYRIANEGDFPELAKMRWSFKLEDKDVKDNDYKEDEFYRECIDFFSKGFRDGTWTHWIAINEDTIVSVISVHHIRKIPKPNRYIDEFGYVTNVYTIPEYRGKKIGSKLMDCVKEWAIEKDFEIMIVWPNSRAIKFYQRKEFNTENDVMELVIRPDD